MKNRQREKGAMEKAKKDTHNETKPINTKTCAVDNKSTILAGSISNTLNPESNINNNILTVNKFGILSSLKTLLKTEVMRILTKTKMMQEEFSQLNDKSVNDCFKEFSETKSNSFETLMRQQQEIQDWIQQDIDAG